MDDAVDPADQVVELAAVEQVGADRGNARRGVLLLQVGNQAGRRRAAEMQAQVAGAGLEQAGADTPAEKTAGTGDQNRHGFGPMAATMRSINWHTRRMCAGGTGSTPRPSMAS